MELKNKEQMDANDIDMLARERLAERMQNLGITEAVHVWPDTERAYLDSSNHEDYRVLATHYGVQYDGEDKSPVDYQLFRSYEDALEDIKEQLKQETTTVVTLSGQTPKGQTNPWDGTTDGTQMVTWRQEDGWYGCLQGIYKGNGFEGDDQGPFDTRDEAEEELRSLYEEE